MVIRPDIEPAMLAWARRRVGFSMPAMIRRFPRYEAWERGSERPTLKQLERFAKLTYTPIGMLFLPEPPVEEIPIPDLRTVGNAHIGRPSPDLLDTIYLCQQRQEWYRDFVRSTGEAPLRFVGSATVEDDIERTAEVIRKALALDLEERRSIPTWTEALRRFIEQAEALGILVMCSGVVANNNRRRLDPDEFRGFAICDDLAPLVFINGADTKAAQMFTLAHELSHIWLGQSALSDAHAASMPDHRVELWCNRVAAELLVPLSSLDDVLVAGLSLDFDLDNLARRFKVSTLVILRRMYDAGRLARGEFQDHYARELERLRSLPRGGGGDFYLTQAARVSKRFVRALVSATLEGRRLYSDAFRLLGISKLRTFKELARSLELVA